MGLTNDGTILGAEILEQWEIDLTGAISENRMDLRYKMVKAKRKSYYRVDFKFRLRIEGWNLHAWAAWPDRPDEEIPGSRVKRNIAEGFVDGR
jgi:hypothetical protein